MRFGAHVSISGRLHLAVDRAVAIGCECLQIFVGNPRQWRRIDYPDEEVALFRRKRAQAGLEPLVAHGAYLINLASPDDECSARSVASLIAGLEEIRRLEGLGVITHIGSRMGQPWREALGRVAAALRVALDTTHEVMVLLENSAGSGDAIGSRFEELAAVLDALDGHPRLGVCLDACHLFAAGYDIRTPEGVAATLRAFDRTVGLDRLRALHLNDSRAPLGSRVDRHENIGQGAIGLLGFRALIHDPRTRHLPGFIETPGFGDRRGPDRQNLEVLKRLRRLGPPTRRRPAPSPRTGTCTRHRP